MIRFLGHIFILFFFWSATSFWISRTLFQTYPKKWVYLIFCFGLIAGIWSVVQASRKFFSK